MDAGNHSRHITRHTSMQHSCPPNALRLFVGCIIYIYYTPHSWVGCIAARDEKQNGIICNQETVKVVPFLKNDGDVVVWNAAACCYYECMSDNFETLIFSLAHTFCNADSLFLSITVTATVTHLESRSLSLSLRRVSPKIYYVFGNN